MGDLIEVNTSLRLLVIFLAIAQAVVTVSVTPAVAVTEATSKYSYEIKNFTVALDHFNFVENRTFSIRYLYNDTYVEKSNPQPPMFFYTGNEGDIEWFAQNTGFMWELAQKFNAYVIFAEHRYYGNSMPFGAETFNKTENLAYFNVEQTLEDFALLITHLRGARQLPVIAFGGSYGGMLSAWFRLKYPHIVAGALAASAPVWQFTDLTPCDIFAKITTSVFETAYNSNCSENIRRSWQLFETLAANDDGKKQLSDLFHLCLPIKNADDLEQFMNYLEDTYGNLAMANYPYANSFLAPLPANPVRQMCYELKQQYIGNDTQMLHSLQRAISVYTNFTGSTKCLNYKQPDSSSNADSSGWDVQTCNQMVMPMCSDNKDTMFRKKEWNFKSYSDECYKKYRLRPKPYDIMLRYGGRNLATASNIIFSNGLLDPWSGGGVLQPPNERVHVIILPEGAHHLDLRASVAEDPPSVRSARTRESDIIEQWIVEFYA